MGAGRRRACGSGRGRGSAAVMPPRSAPGLSRLCGAAVPFLCAADDRSRFRRHDVLTRRVVAVARRCSRCTEPQTAALLSVSGERGSGRGRRVRQPGCGGRRRPGSRSGRTTGRAADQRRGPRRLRDRRPAVQPHGRPARHPEAAGAGGGAVDPDRLHGRRAAPGRTRTRWVPTGCCATSGAATTRTTRRTGRCARRCSAGAADLVLRGRRRASTGRCSRSTCCGRSPSSTSSSSIRTSRDGLRATARHRSPSTSAATSCARPGSACTSRSSARRCCGPTTRGARCALCDTVHCLTLPISSRIVRKRESPRFATAWLSARSITPPTTVTSSGSGPTSSSRSGQTCWRRSTGRCWNTA